MWLRVIITIWYNGKMACSVCRTVLRTRPKSYFLFSCLSSFLLLLFTLTGRRDGVGRCGQTEPFFFVSVSIIYGLCVDAEMSEKTENRGVRAFLKVI